MSHRAEGGDRIVLDPEDLRQVATRMRGASVMLSGVGRDLAARPMPTMPSGVAAAVSEVVCRANAELQDLALELFQEAGTLFARATWAELGGGDAVAWLIPGLHYTPGALPGAAPATPVSALPAVTEEQLLRSEEWAAHVLNDMHDSLQLLDQEAGRFGGKVDEVFGADLIRFADEYADEIPVKALGAFTLAAGIALDVYEHRKEGIAEAIGRAGISAGAGAAGGAVGVALCEATLGWTGVGLVGCLVVGSAGGAWVGDQLGEEVFE